MELEAMTLQDIREIWRRLIHDYTSEGLAIRRDLQAVLIEADRLHRRRPRVVVDFPSWPPQIASVVGEEWQRGERWLLVWVRDWSGYPEPQILAADECPVALP